MPPFPQPTVDHRFRPLEEIKRLREWRDTKPGRNTPQKGIGSFLLGSWNIANFGDSGQPRRDESVAIMAEMLSWFDVAAIQETKINLTDLQRLMVALGPGFAYVTSDVAGNSERMVFVYDIRRVSLLQLAGEIAVPPSHKRHIKLPGIEQKFRGFDRNPYAVAFVIDDTVFTIVNAHLYFGSHSSRSENRRSLETYALGRWADLRMKNGKHPFGATVVIGDLNMPVASPGDPIFDALTKRGLHVPKHQTRLGTTITNNKHYDQLAFMPDEAGSRYVESGVFDFDGAVFSDLWQRESPELFEEFTRFHISDHRPIWASFRTSD